MLSDYSQPTAFERADGNFFAALDRLEHAPTGAPLSHLTDAFNTHIWPSTAAPGTRRKNWRNWRAVLTWAVVRDAVGLVLPMSRDTLKALSWDLIAFHTSRSQIVAVWCAINERHRQ